jgi:DNA-directed RNA polymerase specialized sigma24 family protein
MSTREGRVRDVVEQAMRGDREAFGWLVGQTSDRMYAIATRILRDTHLAEDALQGALITAWRELPTLRDPDRFEAWVRKLLVHACHAEARRRRSWSANVRVRSTGRPPPTRSSRSPTATRSTGRSDA